MSDSECESIAAQEQVFSKTKATSAAAKRKSKTPNSQRNSNKKTKTVDIFGLGEEEAQAVETKKNKLSSYITNRVANGSQRRLATTAGDFYVELKVYQRDDAEASAADERWKKALLRLNCQLEDDSSQWKLLQRFVKEANLLFEESTPTFYSDKLNIKRSM